MNINPNIRLSPNSHSHVISLAVVFAWEAYEHGTDVHTLADPTKLELMHKQFKEKKKNFKSEQQQGILEKVCCVL